MSDITRELDNHIQWLHEDGKRLMETYDYACGCKTIYFIKDRNSPAEIDDEYRCPFHWYLDFDTMKQVDTAVREGILVWTDHGLRYSHVVQDPQGLQAL